MENLVSVIVPVYNGGGTVLRTINSILEQTYQNVEIIVVNDGSTDNTRELIEIQRKTKNNITLINKENGGVSSARNLGIKEAKGSFVSFLDADDTINKDFIEKMLDRLIKSNSDYVFCGYNMIENNRINPQRIRFSDSNLLKKYMLNKTHPASSCWLIDIKILKKFKIEFREGVNWSEDIEFYTKLLSLSKNGTYVDEFLVNYYQNDDETRLSAFSIKKMDEDYSSIQYILNHIITDEKVKRVILDYRLNALLTFRLYEALNQKIDSSIVLNYYQEYYNILNRYSFRNGLRSLKLNICTLKLKIKMKEMKANG